ncbi:hypothetical protein AB0J68_21550 [Micromonospora sp. NPDC049580]|uniref:hypothetical protein n=1 Tax=unclassified Micromonospora TaxID=2617518 RepID=UPI00344AB5D3
MPSAAEEGSGSVVPYRTAFELSLDLAGSVVRVREQLRAWLRQKRYDVERFDAGASTLAPGVVLLHAATNTAYGWQLRETRKDGVAWVSTVAVVGGRSPYRTWVSVNIEPTAPPGVPVPTPRTPGLVRLLLDAVDAFDGEAPLRSAPVAVPAPAVDELLDLVCVEGRRLPVVVAVAPGGEPFERWRQLVTRLMADLPGLASLYILDPTAAQAFNDGIGATHGIGPGSIRTYLPDVDPALVEDGLRHRVLSRRRIETESHRAARALSALPRQLAANSLPPAALKGLNLSLRDFFRSATRRPTADDQRVALADEVKILTSLLETADDADRQARATISRQQDELLDLTAELEFTRNELEGRDATIRALRQRLGELNRHAEAYAPPELPDPLPSSFAELFDRLDVLAPDVVFTGDRGLALDLDEHAAHSNWSQLAWQAMLAMADYARARRDGWSGGDFKFWCETPAEGGRVISAGKVARDESQTVRNNRRFAQQRTLPVPPGVDPRGRVFMGAHVRLGTLATVSPRLHFHDDSAGSGAIYIGYVGRHLSNTATSRS